MRVISRSSCLSIIFARVIVFHFAVGFDLKSLLLLDAAKHELADVQKFVVLGLEVVVLLLHRGVLDGHVRLDPLGDCIVD